VQPRHASTNSVPSDSGGMIYVRQRRRVRLARAYADLQRVMAQAESTAYSVPHPRPLHPPYRRSLRTFLSRLPQRSFLHGLIIALILSIVSTETLVVPVESGAERTTPHSLAATAEALPGLPVPPTIFESDVPHFVLRSVASESLVPALSRPVLEPDLFRTIHELAPGETLGQVAERYNLDPAALIWANNLYQGDALAVGQALRIPHVNGYTYRTRAADTVAGIAEQFGVSEETLRGFSPNRLVDAEYLDVGQEIFIPHPAPELPATLHEIPGGAAGASALAAGPVGIVRDFQTNLREGPDTVYHKVAQLDANRQVALIARHDNWLKVSIAGIEGWIRSDLLQTSLSIAELPLSDDFPPPPPRWVWPTYGSITSRFGPRWGAFHYGLDIANRSWTPIYAARAGWVKEAGWCRGYGYCVKLVHDGGLETIYGHLIERPAVSSGETVTVGQTIGAMGATYDAAGGGYATGVHLHFEVRLNGRPVDPLKFLP
jgi:murein DD-endopeptidase MepM/ murein hydrolase activator NlpD